MTDWIKAIQSVNRGFRPGMEITVMKSRQSGKSLIVDLESSDTFMDWQHVMRPHYVEMYDETTNLQWYRYNRKPSMSVIYEAHKVVRHNEDGSYEYLKNRSGTGIKVLDEEDMKEFLFAILSATRM